MKTHAKLKKRLQELRQKLDERPLPEKMVQKAFKHFRETGELPGNTRFAGEVINRCPVAQEPDEVVLKIAAMYLGRKYVPAEPQDTYMRRLHLEAVYGDPMVRMAARLVLVRLAEHVDVSEPFFRGRKLPDHGSVGFELLGFPEGLAQPPYVEQAKRLFARQAKLREQMNPEDPNWKQDFGTAVQNFHTRGLLATDPWMREAVLADAEYRGLFANVMGRADPKWMEALGKRAEARGAEREAATEALLVMVRERSYYEL